MHTAFRTRLRDVDLQAENRGMFSKVLLQNILRNWALDPLLGFDDMRIHCLGVINVVGERFLLYLNRLSRFSNKDHLRINQRRNERIEILRNLRCVSTRVHATDVP